MFLLWQAPEPSAFSQRAFLIASSINASTIILLLHCFEVWDWSNRTHRIKKWHCSEDVVTALDKPKFSTSSTLQPASTQIKCLRFFRAPKQRKCNFLKSACFMLVLHGCCVSTGKVRQRDWAFRIYVTLMRLVAGLAASCREGWVFQSSSKNWAYAVQLVKI